MFSIPFPNKWSQHNLYILSVRGGIVNHFSVQNAWKQRSYSNGVFKYASDSALDLKIKTVLLFRCFSSSLYISGSCFLGKPVIHCRSFQ